MLFGQNPKNWYIFIIAFEWDRAVDKTTDKYDYVPIIFSWLSVLVIYSRLRLKRKIEQK